MQYTTNREGKSSENLILNPDQERLNKLVKQNPDDYSMDQCINRIKEQYGDHYANIVKDRTNALIYLKKILALDPLNSEINNTIKKLEEVKSN